MPVASDPASSSRESWTALRNASSAAQLAVSMLVGPLAPWRDPAPSAEQLREILAALDATTRQINALVAAMAPSAVVGEPAAANGPVMPVVMPTQTPSTTPVATSTPAPVATSTPAPVATSTAAAPTLAPLAVAPSDEPVARERSRRRPSPSSTRAAIVATPGVAAPHDSVDVGALLRQVAVDASLDPDVRVEVLAPAGLACIGDAEVMRAAIGRLVRDAAAMGPVGAIVEVRATSEPTDALGDEMDVLIEVRPDARASTGQTFAVDPADLVSAAGHALGLEVLGRGGRPRARLRAAMAVLARILAA